jgi:hydroxyethylthiazole kinase-like uncharacterized protein yjeF
MDVADSGPVTEDVPFRAPRESRQMHCETGLNPALYRAAQVRELDRRAIEEFWIPGATLMARAGKAAFEALRQRWPKAKRIVVLAGVGNNAGDGFVVARLCREAGLKVRVLQVSEAGHFSKDAAAAREALRKAGVQPEPFGGEVAVDALVAADVLVDALLGTGLSGEVREPFADAVRATNATPAPVLALDIPSGLDADTGRVLGVAIRADLTVSFIGFKQGMFLGEGPEHCGAVTCSDLAVPPEVYLPVQPSGRILSLAESADLLAPRRRTAHKGDFGHVLVVGGAEGMGGAARMAGEAAARCGAGLTSIAAHPYHAAALSAARPELMAHPVQSRDDLDPLLERASVVALGPGLGRSAWAQAMWDRVMESELPLVVDADGLNLLAEHPQQRSDWVLTPHPGEAARLLGSDTASVQADRFAAAAELQARYGGTVVLKGAGTLVRDGEGPTGLCAAGNPGMASGGMGDVLTGTIAALLAQGLAPAQAARLGVCLHATAADRAARDGERGLLASDLLPHLRALVNPTA